MHNDCDGLKKYEYGGSPSGLEIRREYTSISRATITTTSIFFTGVNKLLKRKLCVRNCFFNTKITFSSWNQHVNKVK